MKYLFLVFIFSLSLLSLQRALPARASCAAASVQEQFNDADLVVRGDVIGTESLFGSSDVRVAVNRVYKNAPPAATILVINPYAPATTSVDVRWEAGKEYLLFLRKTDGKGKYATDVCAGTRLLAGDLTLAELAVLKTGTPFSDVPTKPFETLRSIVLLFALPFLLVSTLAFLILRSKKSTVR